jgi:hypothetical protein
MQTYRYVTDMMGIQRNDAKEQGPLQAMVYLGYMLDTVNLIIIIIIIQTLQCPFGAPERQLFVFNMCIEICIKREQMTRYLLYPRPQ